MNPALRMGMKSAGVLALLLLVGCKEEMTVIYLERIALLPDAFGLLEKEVSDAKWLATGTEEGDGIFYAPDKWKTYLDMTPRK